MSEPSGLVSVGPAEGLRRSNKKTEQQHNFIDSLVSECLEVTFCTLSTHVMTNTLTSMLDWLNWIFPTCHVTVIRVCWRLIWNLFSLHKRKSFFPLIFGHAAVVFYLIFQFFAFSCQITKQSALSVFRWSGTTQLLGLVENKHTKTQNNNQTKQNCTV